MSDGSSLPDERPIPTPRRTSQIKPDWCTGAPERIRTPDPQIRSLMLYPAELLARNGHWTGKPITGSDKRDRNVRIERKPGAILKIAAFPPMELSGLELKESLATRESKRRNGETALLPGDE